LETGKKTNRFIILIPHRDARKPFDDYRSKLFAAGFPGAYSFPAAAPLAALSRPSSREELGEIARNIRDYTRVTDGKILSAGTAFAENIFGKFSFLGLRLDFPLNESFFPQTARKKILHIPVSPVLCAAIADSGSFPPGISRSGENPVLAEAPVLSFRAASLANLAIRPLAGGEADYSFEWKIGPPVWLPKYVKRGSGNGY